MSNPFSGGAISLGITGRSEWTPHVYYFIPENDVFLNRNFSQVTNDGNIYYLCNEFYDTNIGVYTRVIS